MSDFKIRLFEEKKQLDDRHSALESFLKSDKVTTIDPVQVTLLNIQSHAMATYSQCLEERINRLPE